MNPVAIDFCVPFVGSGLPCLEFLIQNAIKTSKNPERLKFFVSYHSEDDLELLKSSSCFAKISRTIYTKPYPENLLFHASANHSLAINNLAANCDGEIIVFSDYDMAFLKNGWDSLIEEEIFYSKSDIVGVAYQPLIMHLNSPFINQHIPWLPNIPLVKYQKIPNLSFFIIKRRALEVVFNRKLTSFHDFLSSGGLPFRLINTPHASFLNNLPLGTMQWLDTGYELPEFIFNSKIKYRSFLPVEYKQQKILDYVSNPLDVNPILLPEIFFLDSSSPFLCHFKKGTAKLALDDGKSDFQKFVNCVNKFLNFT